MSASSLSPTTNTTTNALDQALTIASIKPGLSKINTTIKAIAFAILFIAPITLSLGLSMVSLSLALSATALMIASYFIAKHLKKPLPFIPQLPETPSTSKRFNRTHSQSDLSAPTSSIRPRSGSISSFPSLTSYVRNAPVAAESSSPVDKQPDQSTSTSPKQSSFSRARAAIMASPPPGTVLRPDPDLVTKRSPSPTDSHLAPGTRLVVANDKVIPFYSNDNDDLLSPPAAPSRDGSHIGLTPPLNNE